jgi:threonine dehydrogenase-like Zn-dependent dehydrogenase
MNDSKPSPNETIRGVVFEGSNQEVRVADLPRPKILAPEDAIVRITSTTICGSDLHLYHGILNFTDSDRPYGLGHEAVGIIEEVGGAVDYFQVGDRVLIVALTEDGRLRDKPTLLHTLDGTRLTYGFGPQTGLTDGLQGKLNS